jgi:hypothetical protein
MLASLWLPCASLVLFFQLHRLVNLILKLALGIWLLLVQGETVSPVSKTLSEKIKALNVQNKAFMSSVFIFVIREIYKNDLFPAIRHLPKETLIQSAWIFFERAGWYSRL